jgi:carboxypeptidase Taq
MFGRSHEFWTAITPVAKDIFGDIVNDLDVEDFFLGVNEINSSMIRVEADEFSYDLHIILRYEVERGLLEGNLSVGDAKEYWRERASELFGADLRNDREGILQDMHWSRGGHGGFPSYTIGNVVGAQLLNQLRTEISDYDQQVIRGNWEVLLDWMSQNVHANGAAFGPIEVLDKVCGTPNFDASIYADYLESKSNLLRKRNQKR